MHLSDLGCLSVSSVERNLPPGCEALAQGPTSAWTNREWWQAGRSPGSAADALMRATFARAGSCWPRGCPLLRSLSWVGRRPPVLSRNDEDSQLNGRIDVGMILLARADDGLDNAIRVDPNLEPAAREGAPVQPAVYWGGVCQMSIRRAGVAGLLCLALATAFSAGCRGRSGIPIADNPHVYSSKDPAMRAYESEEEELERLEQELAGLRAVSGNALNVAGAAARS